jgi:protein-S-isoprenylcysteine O-methyltransferase Ste14
VFLVLTLLQTVIVFGALPAVVIFSTAGRLDLWNVWAFLGIFVGLSLFRDLALYRNNPDLLKERIKPAARGRGHGFLLGQLALMLFLILFFSVAGLDQRFHWSDRVPVAGVVAGLAIVAIGLGFTTWATLVNRFFSSAVRIQSDRGQHVISRGPYAIVRHPGYTGVALAFGASALALNSLLLILPTALFFVVGVIRTADEDRMLQKDLAGYADYAAKVRYRLLPGVW